MTTELSTTERARRYLARIPGAVAGANGHDATFAVACALVNGFALSPTEAFPLMAEWNATCQPPWADADLRHKLDSAAKTRHAKPRGYLLGEHSRDRHTPAPRQSAPELKPLPDRSGFRRGTPEQIQRLANHRPYNREGLEWASERGLLVFGSWREFDSYGVTDQSGRVLELRRMDGLPFPAVVGTPLGERKSHAVRGSQKAWPLGIIEAQEFPAIALVEGIPDFLTAHHVILWEQASHHSKRDVGCAPVAMLSSSPGIHPEALPMFRGKHVRIFAHSEGAGLKGAAKWQSQLAKAGAAAVDLFDFSAYNKTDGAVVNDLWEFEHCLHPDDVGPATWRIMP